MTTLATDTNRPFEIGDRCHYGVVASDIIYEGAAVGDNGSGYARPLVSADPFRGFAVQKADNSATATDGYINVEVATKGKIQLTVASVAITDVGRPVYATDDNTFVLTGIGTYIGKVVRYVTTNTAIVAFDAIKGEDLVYASFYVNMASIADGDLITTFTPGFAGRIKAMYWVQHVAVSTGSKASTLNAEIGTTNLTGGTIALTSATCTPLGKIIAAAAITAGAAFTATDTISIEAASTTTFAEGTGTLVIVMGR